MVEDVSVRRPLWWHVLPHRRALLVDLAILLFLGVIHIAAWVELDLSRHRSNDPFETANRVRDTTAVGLTVVGILLPLTALGIQTLANRLRTALQGKGNTHPRVHIRPARFFRGLYLVCYLP